MASPKGKRYSSEQIIGILREADARGAKVGEVIRRHGVTAKTYYRWKEKYAGLDIPDAQRLRQLADENTRLKRLVATQALELQVAKDLLGKEW